MIGGSGELALIDALGDTAVDDAAAEAKALGATLALAVEAGAVLAAGDEVTAAALMVAPGTVAAVLATGEVVAGAGTLLETGATLLGTAGALCVGVEEPVPITLSDVTSGEVGLLQPRSTPAATNERACR